MDGDQVVPVNPAGSVRGPRHVMACGQTPVLDPSEARTLLDSIRGGEISLRFKPVAGRIDQGAGILFNLKPNGGYLLVRANALENNLVLFKYDGAAFCQLGCLPASWSSRSC